MFESFEFRNRSATGKTVYVRIRRIAVSRQLACLFVFLQFNVWLYGDVRISCVGQTLVLCVNDLVKSSRYALKVVIIKSNINCGSCIHKAVYDFRGTLRFISVCC